MTTPQDPHHHFADTILPRIPINEKPSMRLYCSKERSDSYIDGTTDSGQKLLANYIGKPIEIGWVDAQAVATEDWEEPEPHYTLAPTLTIGYLWETTPTHITTITLINQNHIGHGITIPTGCITHITILQ